jgi:hypothetical protein
VVLLGGEHSVVPNLPEAVDLGEAGGSKRLYVVVEGGLAVTSGVLGAAAFPLGGGFGQSGLLVRLDPAKSDALVETTKARFMEMRGAPMRGWLRVGPEDVRTNDQLAEWVRLGTGYARSLPSKG